MNWKCYLIASLDNNWTYIGSTNNFPRRLKEHNGSKRGAKRTRGKTWIPILTISGFPNKNSCLSFESGWKRLSHNRNNKRFRIINHFSNISYKYSNDSRWNRILDLLYFLHYSAFIGNKFKLDKQLKLSFTPLEFMTIHTFIDFKINKICWPYFVVCKYFFDAFTANSSAI